MLAQEARDQIPRLSYETVMAAYNDLPNAAERLLSFVQELLRQKDGQRNEENYLWAASAASTRYEVKELYDQLESREWVELPRAQSSLVNTLLISLSMLVCMWKSNWGDSIPAGKGLWPSGSMRVWMLAERESRKEFRRLVMRPTW